MHLLLAVADNRVFRAREINHLIFAGNEHFVADFVLLAALFIRRDDFDIQAADFVQFDSPKFPRSVFADKGFRRFGEHDRRAFDKAFVAVFIEQNAVFEALKRHCVADVLLHVDVQHDLHAGRRNVK